LFERVIVASGTSNRQTRALASSVMDSVREAGFPKPRIEGEDNGEWIIVDCGAAVAHIMQPAIRQYYHLEEIWGDKPIRLRLGATKPAQPEERAPAPVSKKTLQQPSLRRSSAVKTAEREASAARKTAAKKTSAKSTARSAAGKAALKSPARKSPTARSAPARSAPAKSPARSAPARSAPARSAPAKKAAAKSAAGKPRSR
jgi:ribosome-associated protein